MHDGVRDGFAVIPSHGSGSGSLSCNVEVAELKRSVAGFAPANDDVVEGLREVTRLVDGKVKAASRQSRNLQVALAVRGRNDRFTEIGAGQCDSDCGNPFVRKIVRDARTKGRTELHLVERRLSCRHGQKSQKESKSKSDSHR